MFQLKILVSSTAMVGTIFLSACGTTTSTRALPAYENPIAKTDFQTVRTTAYTHTESDHLEFTNHNALGGELHAAGPPVHRAEKPPLRLKVALDSNADYQLASYTETGPQPFSMNDDGAKPEPRKATRVVTTTKTTTTTRQTVKVIRGKRVVIAAKAQPPKIGSAAADWSRWPAGTMFRVLSTGQIYRVDDYGWALAGRNTIDLYMATPNEMNSWGARAEPIQILQWGDSRESLRLLAPHTGYKHIRRMVLELEGNEQEAAALQ